MGLSSSDSPILVTGFDAFGPGRTQGLNPSGLAAQALHGRRLGGHRIEGVCLPTEFDRAAEQLSLLLDTHRPLVVLSLGQAGGRAAIGLERVAINCIDASLPDNTGHQPIDEPVVPDGPAAYFSTLPIKACVEALHQAGLPAEVSQSAGTFVCNAVFYRLMHLLAQQARLVRAGFVHLPWLPEQGRPHLALNEAVRAIERVILTTLETDRDLRLSGGSIS